VRICYFYLVILCSAKLLASDEPVVGQKVNGWKLVWADEFSVPGRPDPSKWDYERGFVRNHEPQFYRPENATVANGRLVITAQREHFVNPGYQAGSNSWDKSTPSAEYTSASLTSTGKAAWLYGKFEIRGRLDTRQGLWPAFWFMGTQHGWPKCGEVDLMEWYEGELLANACWGPDPSHQKWDTTRRKSDQLKALYPPGDYKDLATWSRDFHTWTMSWDAQSITLAVDGHLLNQTDIAETKVGADLTFQGPMYMILNLAVREKDHPEKTAFPATLEVDWVRVWQRP